MQLTRRRAITTTLAGVFTALLCHAALAGSPGEAPAPLPRPERSPTPGPELKQAFRHSGSSGWMLVDLDSGAVLDAQAADTPFAPASVAKLPTALYALDRLGPDYRFETRLAIAGKVRGETLEGDVILIGGGDPELDTDALLPLVTQLRGRGFRHVTGHFLVDGSAAPQLPMIEAGHPVDAAYDPALSGLNLNFNRVRLKWDARGKARALRVSAKAERLDPEVAGVRVTLASYPGAPVFSHSLEGRAEIWRMNQESFRGEGARWLPVRQPELYAGEVFQGLARTYGIALDPAHSGTVPAGAEVVARHQSRALGAMLRSMLRYSTNLTAEMVGLAASRAGGAAPASLADSAAALNAWAAAEAGFPPGDPGFRLANHSGLSDASRISPRRLVELLAAAARRQPAADGGEPAAIIGLLKDYNIAGKDLGLDTRGLEIAAKTGTMDYVRGLAGYIATGKGRRLAFAIFSNDLGRRAPDTRQIDRSWMTRAQGFERALIRNWLLALEG